MNLFSLATVSPFDILPFDDKLAQFFWYRS